MNESDWVSDTLTLSGHEVPVKVGLLPQVHLRFYPENPRIYSVLCAGEQEPPQEVIQERLAAMDHVKQLVQNIRSNGGLTDPLIVRDEDYVVYEGNSRLAAYRILAKNDPIRWGKVKCKVLPHSIPEDMIFALLGEYHIIGRKDWAPYEQAGYLYRRNQMHGIAPETMAREMGLSARAVNHLIKVYAFMVEHKDNDVNRWSYYDEYHKHNPIKRAREANPHLDDIVVQKIQSGDIAHAVDIRDKLTTVAAAGGKFLAGFVSSKWTLDECHERAQNQGADNAWFKRLNKFRMQCADPDTAGDLAALSTTERKRCMYELRKVQSAVENLLSRLKT